MCATPEAVSEARALSHLMSVARKQPDRLTTRAWHARTARILLLVLLRVRPEAS